MAEDNALVIVAGYQDLDSARHDFDTLTERADDKSVALQAAVLVGKDSDGNPVWSTPAIGSAGGAPSGAPGPAWR
jgi:hypothetical protein